jgi:hypothetical protein
MFRLHIDFPLRLDELTCIDATNKLTNFLEQNKEHLIAMGFTDINYRLGHDDDRQKSNYMIKNENGHVANKKSRINLLSNDSEVE